MRVLISAGWLGGAGGAERNLYSTLKALDKDDVDVVVRHRLTGPWSIVDASVRVHSLQNWRWYAAGLANGWKGLAIQQAMNPVRRIASRRYDAHIRLLGGGHIAPAVRSTVSLLVPSGNPIDRGTVAGYDAIALQAPDNSSLVPAGTKAVLLPPPVFDLAESVEPLTHLPDEYFLTVFNPYDPVKGLDDLARALSTTPLPIVWCHSSRTVGFSIPEAIASHPRLVHVDDPTLEQMRYLYEQCRAYLAFSRREGFGWSIADALRYSRAVVTRPVGLFSNADAWQAGTIRMGREWQPDWDEVLSVPQESSLNRDLALLSEDTYRGRLRMLCEAGT